MTSSGDPRAHGTDSPFLATTALRAFWDESGEPLFLSDWCLRGLTSAERAAAGGTVLANPWDDPARQREAWTVLDARYEQLLAALTVYLGDVHGVSHDRAYWRLLIGPWLLHYLHALHDRYIHLAQAFARHPAARTVVLDPADWRVPFDTLDLMFALRTDDFNLQIMSQLLDAMGYAFPARRLPPPAPRPAIPPPPRLDRLTYARAKVENWLLRRITQARRGRAEVVTCDMMLPTADELSLSLWSGLRAVPAGIVRNGGTWRFGRPAAVFDRARLGLAALSHGDAFATLAGALLPRSFPVLFLEGYAQAAREVEADYPMRPSVILSTLGWYYHEPFKFFAAARAAHGARLVAVQHGAGYGMYEMSWWERHEMRLAHRYVAWGWGDSDRVRNASSLRLSRALRRRPRRPSDTSGDILFVPTAALYPRYLDMFTSQPLASQWESYLDDQAQFLAALPPDLFARVRFRLFPSEHEWPLRDQLTARFPGLRWDEHRPFSESLRRCALVAIDHPGTSMLECLVADVPTVLFWNARHWQIRRTAEPDLTPLRAAGILSATPDEAAEQVRRIGRTPEDWWHGAPVRDARARFIARHALASRDWTRRWGRLLRGLARDLRPLPVEPV